jgi:peptide/nickel transport system permease protein
LPSTRRCAIEVLPGNTAEQLAGANATSEQIERLETALRLDRPPWVRYGEWIGGALRGDLGISLANRQSVALLIGERLPVTLALTTLALALALAAAIPLALFSVYRPGGAVDRAVAIFSITGLSLAGYILGPLLILVFAVQLGILPSIGYVPLSENLLAGLRSLILPATALAVPLIGLYTRFLRAVAICSSRSTATTTFWPPGPGASARGAPCSGTRCRTPCSD